MKRSSLVALMLGGGAALLGAPAAWSAEPTPVPVLVPHPRITIDGQTATPVTSPVVSPGVNQFNPPSETVAAPGMSEAPPTSPQAVPPPVGDIAVSNLLNPSDTVDLGTNRQIPNLVLRDASAREVLSLLARAAGLNLVFVTNPDANSQNQPAGATPVPPTGLGNTAADEGEGPHISLDIQDESVQNVFNTVLEVSGLQANRIGNTIFVGTRLPVTAQNLMIRTLRLNQAVANDVAVYLVTQGAETEIEVPGTSTPTSTVVGNGPSQQTVITTTTTAPTITPLTPPKTAIGPLPLRGLTVSPDARLNTITLIGSPSQVQLATHLISQLDARKRQVVVDVEILEVDLSAINQQNGSFSFGSGSSYFNFNNGNGNINFGPFAPGTNTPASFPVQFLANLQAQVQNGNAKILTDPSLLVQDGQRATLFLTQDVVGNITFDQTSQNNVTTTNITANLVPVGLTLNVAVDRIDDNGFVSLNITPQVTSISGTQNIVVPGATNPQEITLIATREVDSGLVRLRDGQTLILSGIIQDQDRTTVSKVPLLGDIPLLGALFRSTDKQDERTEVIVLVTPHIVGDTDRATFGYGYTPGPEIRNLLNAPEVPVKKP